MKWILILVVLGLYLTGVRRLSNLALMQMHQIEASYTQIINHPESYKNL